MEDYQQRVIDEKKELDSRISRLDCFIRSLPAAISNDERRRMKAQLMYMQGYSKALGERIDAFDDY